MDLSEHINIYQTRLKYADDRIYSIDYILSRLKLTSTELEKDSMLYHLNLMQWVGGIRADVQLYDDLINTGNLNVIRNDSLRMEIQNYYNSIFKFNSTVTSNNGFYLNNGLKFYMKHLSQGNIIRTISGVDKELGTEPDRKLFELWDMGYYSKEMKEFENNLYFRRTDLSLELSIYETLVETAELLSKSINSYLKEY